MPRNPCRVAWFRTWFHLVPLGSRGCRKAASHYIHAGWLGSGLGSTWFQRLQKSSIPLIVTISMQGGLVPVLVPLGSRGCRKAASHFPVAGRPPRKVHFSFKSLYKSCSFEGLPCGGGPSGWLGGRLEKCIFLLKVFISATLLYTFVRRHFVHRTAFSQILRLHWNK